MLIGELEADAGAAEARDTAGDPDAGQDTNQPVKRRERKQPVRTPLPPHLPRETITHEAACTCPGCGGTVFSRIGQDEREVLEYVPSSFKVIRHIRPKLSCRACETIVQAPMPSLPIERGRPGPGLLAQVLVAKYLRPYTAAPPGRHLCPRRRRTRSLDLADWVGQSVFLLAPLAEAIGRHVRAGQVLHADDTTVPVLAPGLGKTKTGRLWVVVRDERPFGSDIPPAAFYRYSPDRKGIHAQALLGPLPRLSSCRRLRRVRQSVSAHHAGRRAAADRGGMLEPRTPEILRHSPRLGLADRAGSHGADRRPVRHREQHSRTAT